MIPTKLDHFRDPTKVLDHGSVTLLDIMGDDDDAILQAARTSTGAGTSKHKFEGESLLCTVCKEHPQDVGGRCVEGDRGLIRYLYRNRHATPFESCRIKLHVRLPIFVERQWVRHRTAGLNEMSARYKALPEEFYIPDPSVRPMAQAKSNRQGSEGGLSDMAAEVFEFNLRTCSENAFASYREALDAGVAKEIARLFLPVNVYTEKVWWCDLRNLLGFLSLRLDPHAQWEIRMYAEVIWKMVQEWVPFTASAFEDYTLGSKSFSAKEVAVLRDAIGAQSCGDPVEDLDRWRAILDAAGITSKRERGAFLRSLGIID